jgi:hypothetical protein
MNSDKQEVSSAGIHCRSSFKLLALGAALCWSEVGLGVSCCPDAMRFEVATVVDLHPQAMK